MKISRYSIVIRASDYEIFTLFSRQARRHLEPRDICIRLAEDIILNFLDNDGGKKKYKLSEQA